MNDSENNSSTKVALVTGANKGIGRAVSAQLLDVGYHVVLLGRSEKRLKEAINEFPKETSKSYIVSDLSQIDSLDAVFDFVDKNLGRLDVLINNAGVFLDPESNKDPSVSSAIRVAYDVVESSFKLNTLAPYRLCQLFLPMMIKQDYGRIVNVSSGYGQITKPSSGIPGYRISKLALNGLTRIFSQEAGTSNVKVNSVCPGWVRTDMGGAAAPRTPEEAAIGVVWAATLNEDGPTGSFFRDQKEIDW